MTLLGMDADVVESVGKQLKHEGESVTSVIRTVDGLIERAGANWWGAHGRDLAQQWRTVHRPALLKVAGAVDGLGQSAVNNAREQRGVSAAGAGERVPSGAPAATATSGSSEGRFGIDFIKAAQGSGGVPVGFTQLSGTELSRLGLDRGDLHDGASGFAAAVFSDGKGHYVVAFPGTEVDGSILYSEDALADAQGALYTTRQSEQSAVLGKTIATAVGPEQVTFVGHSLGGRNAAIASVASGATAITYNAAGVHNADVTYAMLVRGDAPSLLDYAGSFLGVGGVEAEKDRLVETGQVVNHHTTFDLLTTAQNAALGALPSAIGRQDAHASPLLFGDAHGLDGF